MSITGVVYSKVPQGLADIVVTEGSEYKIIEIKVSGQTVIMFPLPLTADTNEIKLRTANVIEQSAYSVLDVLVEVTEV